MNINVNKQGILQSQSFTEYHIEPDGSIWELCCAHINPSENIFNSSDTFSTGIIKNKNLYFNFNTCNSLTNNWEFLVKQKNTLTSNLKQRRWVQHYNPLLSETTYDNVSYANIESNTAYSTDTKGGIYRGSGNTYLRMNNGSNGNWYGATGCWTVYQSGIPGFFQDIITTGYLLIYVRVDNQDKNNAKFYDLNITLGGNLYEY